jgi:hypothetical protein
LTARLRDGTLHIGGTSMSNTTDSEVIRWRIHTRESRIYAWIAFGLIGAGAAIMVGGGGGGSVVGLLLVLAALFIMRQGRKRMTEVLRPRPKRAVDKRDFGRLLAGQMGVLLAAVGGFLWLGYEASKGPLSLPLMIGGVVAGVGFFLASGAFRRAYERLFDRIAGKDGAYGL